MSKESAKKLISELQTNEALKAKVQGITDPAALVKAAIDAGYDVTEAELIEAEKELKTEQAERTDAKLSLDDLEAAAGGGVWQGEDAPDGHEMGCVASYHHGDYSMETHNWCKNKYFLAKGEWCNTNNISFEQWMTINKRRLQKTESPV